MTLAAINQTPHVLPRVKIRAIGCRQTIFKNTQNHHLFNGAREPRNGTMTMARGFWVSSYRAKSASLTHKFKRAASNAHDPASHMKGRSLTAKPFHQANNNLTDWLKSIRTHSHLIRFVASSLCGNLTGGVYSVPHPSFIKFQNGNVGNN